MSTFNHEGKTVLVTFEYPPIPSRHFDYMARFEDADEYGPFGWGKTEEDALADLLDTVEFEAECETTRRNADHFADLNGADEAYRRDLISAGRGHLLKD